MKEKESTNHYLPGRLKSLISIFRKGKKRLPQNGHVVLRFESSAVQPAMISSSWTRQSHVLHREQLEIRTYGRKQRFVKWACWRYYELKTTSIHKSVRKLKVRRIQKLQTKKNRLHSAKSISKFLPERQPCILCAFLPFIINYRTCQGFINEKVNPSTNLLVPKIGIRNDIFWVCMLLIVWSPDQCGSTNSFWFVMR